MEALAWLVDAGEPNVVAYSVALLIGRLAIGICFVVHGLGKLGQDRFELRCGDALLLQPCYSLKDQAAFQVSKGRRRCGVLG